MNFVSGNAAISPMKWAMLAGAAISSWLVSRMFLAPVRAASSACCTVAAVKPQAPPSSSIIR